MRANVRRGILALAPWPLVPSCVVPRLIRRAPGTALRRCAYLAAYAALVVALAIIWPWTLVPLAAAVAFATAVEAWFGRHGYGTRRGLPPGGLPLVPVSPLLRPDHLGRLLRRSGPVAKAALPPFDGHVACVHGLQRGAELLRHEEDGRLQWHGIVYDHVIPAGYLRTMMPSVHTRYRRVIRASMSPDVVEMLRPAFAAHAREAVASLLEASASKGVDPREHLRRYATDAFLHLFYGLQPGDPRHARASMLYGERGPLGERPRGGVRAVDAAIGEMADMLADVAREAAAGSHARSSFAGRLGDAHPEFLRDPNVTRNLAAICGVGSRDVAALLHWIVALLGDAPDWQERARTDRAGDVVTWIVLETLRLQQSEFVMRRVLEPVDVEGHTIPAGWLVRVCVRESHRDDATFERPSVFDPGRFAGARLRRSQFAPFGMRRHSCLGVPTTTATTTEFVRALTRRALLVTTRDGAPEYDYVHWRPSSRHRVRLVSLPPGTTTL